jgi:hypothetical protein
MISREGYWNAPWERIERGLGMTRAHDRAGVVRPGFARYRRVLPHAPAGIAEGGEWDREPTPIVVNRLDRENREAG